MIYETQSASRANRCEGTVTLLSTANAGICKDEGAPTTSSTHTLYTFVRAKWRILIYVSLTSARHTKGLEGLRAAGASLRPGA